MNFVLFPVFPSSTNGFHEYFGLVVWDSIPPFIFGDLHGESKNHQAKKPSMKTHSLKNAAAKEKNCKN